MPQLCSRRKNTILAGALLLSLLCVPSIHAQTDDYDDDFWRFEGWDPTEDDMEACEKRVTPTARMHVGSTVTLDFTDICDYEGILLQNATEWPWQNVAWLQYNHYVDLHLALSTGGYYHVELRVSSLTGDGAFDLSDADTGEVYLYVPRLPSTGSWEVWENITTSPSRAALHRGSSTLRVSSLRSGWNLLWVQLTLLETIQWESYDYMILAQDFTYTDSNVGLANSSEAGVLNLDYLDDGNELFFDLKVNDTGKYTLYARVSNPDVASSNYGKGSFAIYDTDTSELYAIINPLNTTASLTNWTTSFVGDLYLTGNKTYHMTLFVLQGGFNLEFLGLDLETKLSQVSTPSHYLHPARDTVSMTGVTEDSLNHNLGNIANGAVIDYELDVASSGAGSYSLYFWVASPDGWGSFHVLNSETQETYGQIASIPVTSDWTSWEPVRVGGVSVASGTTKLPLRLQVEQGGFNFFVVSYRLVDGSEGDDNSAADEIA